MATRMNPPRPGWRFAQRASRQAFPNDPRQAHEMRAFVGDYLVQMDIPENIADEILMAVGEVVANACRHGRRPTRPGNVKLACELDDSVVCISVADVGPGFDVDSILGTGGMPDLLSPGGRGFFLMHQLMDHVDVDSSRRGTKVVLRRRLPR